MKPKLSFFAACLLLVSMLSGCVASPSKSQTAATTQAAPETSLQQPDADSADRYLGLYADSEPLEYASTVEITKAGGSYHVAISLYRLALLEDGAAVPTEDGMAFTAPDAAGNSVTGLFYPDGGHLSAGDHGHDLGFL